MLASHAVSSLEGKLDSIAAILGVAEALERAAATQYAGFAEAMRRVGHHEVAAIFADLAAEERHHVQSVLDLARAAHVAPATPATSVPATIGTAEIGPFTLISPYRALSVAVQAEEKAFTFWAYVASRTTSAEVRQQAEAMARQELVHAAKLRHARRRAYHADRARLAAARAGADPDIDFAARRAGATGAAAEAVDFLSAAAVHLQGLGHADDAALLRDVAAGWAAEASTVSPSADGRLAALRRIELSAAAGRSGLLFDAAGRLEHLLETYLDLLDRAPDEDSAAALQESGGHAARDVARVNARLYALEPDLARLTAEPAGTEER